MANYTSNLKTWGSVGSEFPGGYGYLEGEQPVDEWDNFVNYNVISDIIDHLVPLTNSRIESDSGTAGSEPASPEASHLYYDTDNERLEHWDSDGTAWRDIANSADSLTVTAGTGLTGGGSFPPTGGSVSVDIDMATLSGDGLKDGGSGVMNVEPADFAGNGLQDDGSDNLALVSDSVTVTAGNQLTGGGAVALGDSITINLSEGPGSGLDADTVDGIEGSSLQTSVSNDGSLVLSGPSDIDFGVGIDATDDGDGTASAALNEQETEDLTIRHNSQYAPNYG